MNEINERMSPERLPNIAKTLVDALNQNAGLEIPIAILVDGRYDELDNKLFSWLEIAGRRDRETDQSVRTGEAQQNMDVSASFLGFALIQTSATFKCPYRMCFNGAHPVVITAGPDVFKMEAQRGATELS